MFEQFMQVTEAWINLEFNEIVEKDNSTVWSNQKKFAISDPEEVKRWFLYLQEFQVIPNHYKLDIFTIPNPSHYSGEDMIVLYLEGQLWSGFSMDRFTGYSGYWNEKGLREFFAILFVGESESGETLTEDFSGPSAAPSSPEVAPIGMDWDELEDEEDLDRPEETDSVNVLDTPGEEDEFYYEEDDDYPYEDRLLEEDDHNAEQFLKSLEVQIDQSLQVLEECVDESIQLTANQMGSKKLVKLILKAEENISELKANFLQAAVTEED